MEYIFVTFDPKDIRDVLADGNPIGQTETTLTLPTGYYLITLSGSGYRPVKWAGTIAGTSPASPLQIRFTPVQRAVHGNV